MRTLFSLRTAILAAAAALLSAGAQAGPMPTNVAAMKSMVDQSTTEVRWGGGWRGGGFGYRGVGFRGGGWGYRGGYGYRALGLSRPRLRPRSRRHSSVARSPAAPITAAATMAAIPTATRPPRTAMAAATDMVMAAAAIARPMAVTRAITAGEIRRPASPEVHDEWTLRCAIACLRITEAGMDAG